MNNRDWPVDLPGSNPASPWCNKLKRAALSSHIKDVKFVGGRAKLIPGADGQTLVISGVAGVGSAVKTFQITAIGLGDYFTAQTLSSDGTTLGGVDFQIAKARDFRTSLTSEVVDGVTIAHVYSDDNHRTSDDGANSQNEICWPRFVVGAEIRAALSANSTPVLDGSTPLQWADLTNRVWFSY